MNKSLCTFLLVASCLFITREAAAQNTMGRWSLGFRGGSNIWFNDYETKKYGFEVILVVRDNNLTPC